MPETMKCLYCGESHQNIPLIHVTYKGQTLFVCSSHLPMLIHEPEKLVTQLEQATSRSDNS